MKQIKVQQYTDPETGNVNTIPANQNAIYNDPETGNINTWPTGMENAPQEKKYNDPFLDPYTGDPVNNDPENKNKSDIYQKYQKQFNDFNKVAINTDAHYNKGTLTQDLLKRARSENIQPDQIDNWLSRVKNEKRGDYQVSQHLSNVENVKNFDGTDYKEKDEEDNTTKTYDIPSYLKRVREIDNQYYNFKKNTGILPSPEKKKMFRHQTRIGFNRYPEVMIIKVN